MKRNLLSMTIHAGARMVSDDILAASVNLGERHGWTMLTKSVIVSSFPEVRLPGIRPVRRFGFVFLAVAFRGPQSENSEHNHVSFSPVSS